MDMDESGLLVGDGKHSRCCRLCGVSFCHQCKFINMTKIPLPNGAVAAGETSSVAASSINANYPRYEDDEGASSSCFPPFGPGLDLPKSAKTWTCRPCAAANGVVLDGKACVACDAPWMEMDSYLGSGRHSRACTTCGKA